MLSGCTAEYNLNISNNKINESFSSIIYKNEIPVPNLSLGTEIPETDDQLTPFIEEDKYPFSDNHEIIYNKEVVEEDDDRLVNYSYTYTPKEFANSRNMTLCFENANYKYSNNYKFSLSGKFYCLYNDSLDINVTTHNKVISHNADQKNGNKYTWHIDRNNVENIDIEMEIKRNSLNKAINNNMFVIVVVCLILIGLIVSLIIYLKKKKSNYI